MQQETVSYHKMTKDGWSNCFQFWAQNMRLEINDRSNKYLMDIKRTFSIKIQGIMAVVQEIYKLWANIEIQ